ncbi:unnamed protein product [Diabrotica balteata]|uniref:Chitin-binding type-2 domain-containing protein n=1 Tax=Diabrotica balteata TaxID=107213 RepID=A0A9P0E2U5_DIABA|nr:unnamed protein product [Diabrotica balteata]
MKNTMNFILVLVSVLGVTQYTSARHAKSTFDHAIINLLKDIAEDCKNGLEVFEYYPYDCQKYYSCNNGAPEINTCHDGTYWNDKVKACDIKEDVDCSNIIPFPAHIIPEPESTSAAPQPSTVIPDQSTIDPDLHCDKDLEYFADPYNCQGYYQCLNGIKQHEFCNEGLLWNVHIPGCDEESDCSQLLVSTEVTGAPTAFPTEGTTASVCQEGDRNEYLPDCHRFFECENNRWIGPLQCPADLYWSQENKKCVTIEQSDCNKH